MKNAFFILTALLLSAFTFDVKAQTLVNGTFNDNPSYKGWTIQVVNDPIANQQKDGNPGGYVWLNHNGGASDPSLSQDIKTLKVGTEYLIGGSYKVGKHANIHKAAKSMV